jgi:branched-chain amino acid transport system permease protein
MGQGQGQAVTDWLNIVIQGSLLGGIYALFAIGLSMSFGIMRLVNIAHGDLIVLSAYAALVVTDGTGLDPISSLVIVVPVMFVLGYALQRGLLNHTLNGGLLPPLLVTFGISVIIQNGLLEGFGAYTQRLKLGAVETASLQLPGGISIGVFPLLVFAVALVALGSLQLLFYRTRLGRAFRAVSDDADTAELMGIDDRQLYALALGIAMIFTAIAGVLFAIRTIFDPAAGPIRLILAFEAVIIGGLGSMWGTLIGGIVLGLAQATGAALSPTWQILAGHIAFLAILIVRPNGLFPRTRD